MEGYPADSNLDSYGHRYIPGGVELYVTEAKTSY